LVIPFCCIFTWERSSISGNSQMKEYTLLSFVAVFIAIALDRLTGAFVLKERLFYVYALIILFFKFLVNGYLTAEPVVIYNPRFMLGLRVGVSQLRIFFLASVWCPDYNIWECFKGREK